jgi:hypothetical protein
VTTEELALEVERLRGVLARIESLVWYEPQDDDDTVESVRAMVRERDEARAEAQAWQAEELARRTERDAARAEVERLKAHFILIAQACGNEDPDTAHHAVRARVAERDAAVAKAAAYERDWYDAKSEFGTATAKLRERVRVVERERDRAQAQLENVLDASKKGAWMARALDAECERDELKTRLAHAEADAEQAIHNEAFNERMKIVAWMRNRVIHKTTASMQTLDELVSICDAIHRGEHE